MKIGRYNTLKVNKIVDFGVYLADDEGNKVLLPARYLEEVPEIGDEMNVFVYTDGEDRPIATTEHPYAQVGDVAFMQVVDVNKVGAFLDWGIMKHILVPYREQKYLMKQGGIYPVYVFLDHVSGRVVASAKLEKYIGNVFPTYKRGARVKALVLQHTEPGYKVIVDNLHFGMLYHNELFREITVGEEVDAFVKQVREDGKIDLTLSDKAVERVGDLSETVYNYIVNHGGRIAITDSSSPEDIKTAFHCSKRDFKKAVGALYKAHRIEIMPDALVIH